MKLFFFALLGALVGCVGGMVGIGGGVLMVPALTELFGLDQRKAAGLTLAAMVPPVTLPGVIQYYRQGSLVPTDLLAAVSIAVFFATGVFFGARLQAAVNVSFLRLGLGLLMLYVAVRLIIHSNSEASNAAAGLAAVITGWLSYLGLRALGRRHAPPPSVAEAIGKQTGQSSSGPPDYII
jgi:uncharacterized protein